MFYNENYKRKHKLKRVKKLMIFTIVRGSKNLIKYVRL